MTDGDFGRFGGCGPNLFGPRAPRGEITREHVEFARARRRQGVGWQNIGNMLGVHADSLRRVVEGELPVAPAVPKRAAKPHVGPYEPGKHPRGRENLTVRLLRALARGCIGHAPDLAKVVEARPASVATSLSRIVSAGLASRAAYHAPACLTRKGVAELARLDREAADHG